MDKRTVNLDEELAIIRFSPHTDRVERAWEKLYTELWPYAFAVSYRMLHGDADAAQDVTQIAFLRLVRSIAITELEDSRTLRRYLGRIARQSAIDHLRIQAGRRHTYSDTFGEAGDVPDKSPLVDDIIQRDEVFAAISRELSESDLLLASRIIDGYSLRELEAEFRTSSNVLRVRLHRLRQRIRKLLTKLLGDPPPSTTDLDTM